MKQRVISALVGIGILGVVLGLYDSYVLNAAVSSVGIIGLDELLHGAGYKHRATNIAAYAYAATIPFLLGPALSRYVALINYGFAVLLILIFLGSHREVRIEQVAMTVLFTMVIAHALSTLIACRDNFGTSVGMFYNLVGLAAAWGTDTCAYFAGRQFGKRKLAPNISPKKTVEGAIGGGLGGAVTVLALSYVYALYQSMSGVNLVINYGALLAALPFLVVSGMLGDLAASAIKRQFGIKDFGHIMPGHGGVLDRFDSVLGAMPLVYVIVRYVTPLAWIG